MIKKQNGFTLVEVLISLFISAFIIFGMLQVYRNLQKFINKTYAVAKINKKIYLVFSQLEKDFSTALIPKIDKANKKKEDSDKKQITYFNGDMVEGEYKKVKTKRLELFKSLNFINTNPLQVYSKRKVRLVRILYSLKKNKEKSKRDRNVYDLYRQETADLDNVEFKENENIKKKNLEEIKTYLVAKDVKHFSVEYYGFEKEEQNKNKTESKEKKRMINSFSWGKDKKTENVIPHKFLINLTFWDARFVGEYSYDFLVPTFIVNLEDKDKETKGKKNTQKDSVENKKQV